MTSWIAEVAGVLLQLPAAAGDTVLVKQVVSEPSWWERVTSIASGLVSIAIIVLTFALVPAAWNFRKSYKKISDLLDRVYADVNPITKHAHNIADNVDYISTSIRVDVQQVNRTIASANEKLQQAVAMTEQRLNDFNAFLQVVQSEAEDVFVASASTLHGMRSGAAAYREAGRAGELDDLDELEELDDLAALDALEEDEDEDDAFELSSGAEQLLDDEALIALDTRADADAMSHVHEVNDGNVNEAEGRGPAPRIRPRAERDRTP